MALNHPAIPVRKVAEGRDTSACATTELILICQSCVLTTPRRAASQSVINFCPVGMINGGRLMAKASDVETVTISFCRGCGGQMSEDPSNKGYVRHLDRMPNGELCQYGWGERD